MVTGFSSGIFPLFTSSSDTYFHPECPALVLLRDPESLQTRTLTAARCDLPPTYPAFSREKHFQGGMGIIAKVNVQGTKSKYYRYNIVPVCASYPTRDGSIFHGAAVGLKSVYIIRCMDGGLFANSYSSIKGRRLGRMSLR